jgi:hypothetical protein
LCYQEKKNCVNLHFFYSCEIYLKSSHFPVNPIFTSWAYSCACTRQYRCSTSVRCTCINAPAVREIMETRYVLGQNICLVNFVCALSSNYGFCGYLLGEKVLGCSLVCMNSEKKYLMQKTIDCTENLITHHFRCLMLICKSCYVLGKQ